jgi:CheY-like chemotaxis protein
VANFQVIDTGNGIEEEQLQNIFQPFTRVSLPSGNAVAGSGLGLTISKIMTEIMGGELTVKSQPGQGSTFTVRLLMPSLGADTEAQADTQIVGYRSERRKLLIVDDQVEHRELLMAILEPLGFYLNEASSGEECLQKIADNPPDLILLDISMTGINGIETAIQLRQQEWSMPILVLSANAYPNDRLAALNAGCNDFLPKPVNIQELLDKLKQHLKLDWLYQDKQPAPKLPGAQTIKVPPTELLEPCVAHVRIGDIQGLKSTLEQLCQTQPQYSAYFVKLKSLANEFRIGEIRNLLKMTTAREKQ